MVVVIIHHRRKPITVMDRDTDRLRGMVIIPLAVIFPIHYYQQRKYKSVTGRGRDSHD